MKHFNIVLNNNKDLIFKIILVTPSSPARVMPIKLPRKRKGSGGKNAFIT